MALTYEFLIDRAEQASQEAAAAVLDNVRDRALRSEMAWRTIANQVLEVQTSREAARHEREASRIDRASA